MNKTILLAEDDADDLEFLISALSELDRAIKFEIAATGAEAITLLHSLVYAQLPCLIILDVNMPVLDGISTLRLLHDDELLKGIPTVIYTTSGFSADKAECLALGAVDYIVKPGNPEEVNIFAGRMLRFCK